MKHIKHLKIPFQVIKSCTNEFHQSNFIGRGGYGKVYKGILCWADHDNRQVAVQRLDVTGSQGTKEFHTEVTILSRYHHENIVPLVGFCDEQKEMILVYEYASNGSFDTYLSDPAKFEKLSWPILLNICIDIVSALKYLHNDVATKHRIIHRDIKSGNILLYENWKAKVSDFGLCRIGLANQHDTFVITHPAGTRGYYDPQYEKTGILTKESDVYSFGVVLFEVLCGRPALVYNYNDERRFLHHWARSHYRTGELNKIIHNQLKQHIKPRTLSNISSIAYRCLEEIRDHRPTMDEVALRLKEAKEIQFEETIIPTSNLPPKLPPLTQQIKGLFNLTFIKYCLLICPSFSAIALICWCNRLF